jgi:sugar phosphate isomerase/epimerase
MCAEGQGKGVGTLADAAANLREAGAVCARYNVRFSFEFSSTAAVMNSLAKAREVQRLVDHPNVGLLLDAYHLERSGSGGRGFAGVPAGEIFAFQYSDVPPTPLVPGGPPQDRVVPGKGQVRWREVFGLLEEKNYVGYISYEAPNPGNEQRSAHDVAREACEATRALLAGR